MCGIAALFSRDPQVLTQIVAMNTALRHRGPDDEGYAVLGADRSYTYGGADTPAESLTDRYPYTPTVRWSGEVPAGAAAVLAQRRLSILDLSPGGHQPLCSADGRYWITFNGEVYNYRELRQELETRGHTFRSHTDTEVVVAAYREWGPDCLPRFKGMWAFVLVDTVARDVFAARDFFGIKPLYYTVLPDGLGFASEVKALLAMPGVSRQVEPTALRSYLVAGVCDYGADTLLTAVKQLPPATYLRFSLDHPGEPAPVPYWQIDLRTRLDLSFDEAKATLRDLFLQSIRLHLRSDVPLGATLSGGIDSSAVVMAMRHLEGPGLDLHTFSYVAEDAAISEERWMDQVIAAAKARPFKTRPGSQDLVADLKRLIEVQELPFGSTSIFAQMRIFQVVRQHGIKVMLDGQGADEMLAGYPGYFPSRLVSSVWQGHWMQALRFFRAASAHPNQRYLRQYAVRRLLPQSLVSAIDRARAPKHNRGVVRTDWFDDRQAFLPTWPHPRGADAFREELLGTLTTSSLPALLRYADRNSMAHSIESRVPFLEPELTAFLFALPDRYLLSNESVTKHVFREAMRGIVPDPILDRQDKIGFETPERRWLLQVAPWVTETLGGDVARQIPVWDADMMLQEWQGMADGSRPFDWRFWRWLNLIHWARRFDVTF